MAEIPSSRPDRPFVTPPEVLAYFREKRQAPRFSWLDVFGQEHARAITVAKAVETELLTAFETTLDGALARGEGLETWKKTMLGELKRLGWDKPREVKDPELRDRSRTVDFTRPRRLQTIFWSNMNAARAAGQWDRIQRTKRALPMLLYVRSTASEPRPAHLAWVGIILPADHPFWRTHFPPNGWGCLCTVRQITSREADRLLEAKKGANGIYYVDQPPDDGPPQIFVNRRTGQSIEIPAGIDPGWHTNPGLARSETLTDKLADTLSAAGEETARAQIRSILASRDLPQIAKLPDRARLPVAVATDLADELGAQSGIVSLSNDTLAVKVGKHGIELGAAGLVQEIVDQGEKLGDAQRQNVRNYFAEIGGSLWNAAIGVSANGFLYVRTLHRSSRRRIEALKRALRAAGRT